MMYGLKGNVNAKICLLLLLLLVSADDPVSSDPTGGQRMKNIHDLI